MGYEDYFKKCQEFTIPDLVCVFNCGFHEFSKQPEKDTWKPALPFLTKFTDVPLIFTSYTFTEAEKDFELIQKFSNNDIVVEACKIENPFRSHRPVRDFEFDNDCDVFYCNQFLSVVHQ